MSKAVVKLTDCIFRSTAMVRLLDSQFFTCVFFWIRISIPRCIQRVAEALKYIYVLFLAGVGQSSIRVGRASVGDPSKGFSFNILPYPSSQIIRGLTQAPRV